MNTENIVVIKKNTLNLKNIWFAIVALFFIKPGIVEDVEVLDFIFNAGRMGFSVVYIVLMLAKQKKIIKDEIFLALIFLVVFSMTVLYGGIYSKAITHYIPAIGLLFFIIYYKNNILQIFEVTIKLNIFLLVLNLITFFCFPNGITSREGGYIRVWILGQKQDLAGFIFPMLYIALCLKGVNHKYKKTFIYSYIISMITVFVEQSITALICLLLLGLLYIFDNFLAIRIKKSVLIGSCLIAFGIVQYISYNFATMTELQALLLRINTVGSSKVRTLSTRFSMWKFAWDIFFQHPILGMGELSRENWIKGVGFYHSVLDNLYMDLIMTGGIVAIGLFLLLLGRSFNMLSKFSNDSSVRFLSYCLFVVCIYSFFGSPFCPMLFLLFTSSAWFPYLKANSKIEK